MFDPRCSTNMLSSKYLYLLIGTTLAVVLVMMMRMVLIDFSKFVNLFAFKKETDEVKECSLPEINTNANILPEHKITNKYVLFLHENLLKLFLCQFILYYLQYTDQENVYGT